MTTEKRLKDVSLFEKALEKHRGLVMHNEDILAALANCPTVDAVEVVHGRWIVGGACNHVPRRIKNPEKWVIYECSQCGYSNGRKRSNYCPNCGADMRGSEE